MELNSAGHPLLLDSPVIDADFDARGDAFVGHDLRVTVGAGVRF